VTLAVLKKTSFPLALLLAGCSLLGCVPAPQQNSAWPWNTKNDYDMQQTGNFISASVGVAQFGAAPAAVKPAAPEAVVAPRTRNAAEAPPASAQPIATAASAPSPSAPAPALLKKATGPAEYDFSLKVMTLAPASYLSVETGNSQVPVTAFNRGPAPVSLAFSIDESTRQNWSSDRPWPVFAVIPPNSETVVARLSPKTKNSSGGIKSSYLWFLGDYHGSYAPAEHYQLPFPKNVSARVSLSTDSNAAPSVKHAVIFVMPASTPILAARKGTVVRIKGKRVDVLHDDSSIASYEHLGEIDQALLPGKVVSTDDRIGTVGALGKEKDGYLQLTVWQPQVYQPVSPRADRSEAGFDIVSLPLEFCSPNFKSCRALTNQQLVSKTVLGKAKNKK
jgi:murein DD-endopeptidase MepM/ murein hydrolase activator NlpD